MPKQPTVAVVINPTKKDAEQAKELLLAACAAAGRPEPLFFETAEDDPGHQMARDALAAGASIVVAAGGDGTVRAVAEELATAEQGRLGILPLGTGNLLARNVGIDVDDLETAAAVAVGEHAEPVDALRITVEHPDRSTSTMLSVVASGLGLDAEVMDQTNEGLKKAVGPAAYAATGVAKMVGLKRHPVRISVDDAAWETAEVRTLMLVNAGYIQGGLQYAPGSRHDDGVQNAVLMSPRGLAGWAVVAAKMLFRLRKDVGVVSYLQGQSIAVRTFYPVQAQVDGDPIGEVIGMESVILPHALSVQAPLDVDKLPPGGTLAKIVPANLVPANLVPEELAPKSLLPRAASKARSLLKRGG